MSPGVQKALIIFLDLCLAAYIVVAVCKFHSDGSNEPICRGVSITITDGSAKGFIDEQEVRARLAAADLDPQGVALRAVSCREIEETLAATPFVNTVECYTTIDGMVNINLTQLLPVVRIMANNDDDFYVDDKDCIMPISNFTSNIIVATGNINTIFATTYLSPLARALTNDTFCRNLFQQINVADDESIELIPQVGNSVIVLGQLPQGSDKKEQDKMIADYIQQKMNVLKQFYKYGLPAAGWNNYSVINLAYDNQIVCKRR